MSAARIDSLVWILVYGGLFVGGAGFALWKSGASYGTPVMAFGIAAVVAGIVLIVVRSRMPDPTPDPRPAPGPAATHEKTP